MWGWITFWSPLAMACSYARTHRARMDPERKIASIADSPSSSSGDCGRYPMLVFLLRTAPESGSSTPATFAISELCMHAGMGQDSAVADELCDPMQ